MDMNRFTIYLLALGVFLTATSELVVSGILYAIADDLHISLAFAGQLITAYSLAFAIGTRFWSRSPLDSTVKECCSALFCCSLPAVSFPISAPKSGCSWAPGSSWG